MARRVVRPLHPRRATGADDDGGHMAPRPRPLANPRGAAPARTALTAALLASCLAGCSAAPPSDPVPEAPPTLSPEQQDEEAFEQQYARYVSLPLDSISEEDLAPLLTGDVLAESAQEIEAARDGGRRVVGRYTYSAFTVTEHGVGDDGSPYMIAKACLDVTGSRILGPDGQDITPVRDSLLSMQMKAVEGTDTIWRISDALRNDEVSACA